METEPPLELQIEKLRNQELIQAEIIEEKNAIIDRQRVKIKNYEFAIEEAMQYLAKPLNKFEEWINAETTETFRLDPTAVGTTTANVKKPTEKRESIDLHSKVRASRVSQLSAKGNLAETPKFVSTESMAMTKAEIMAMECMRLCFLFLRNCQIQNTAIDNGTYQVPETEDLADLAESDISLAVLPKLPTKEDPFKPLEDIADEDGPQSTSEATTEQLDPNISEKDRQIRSLQKYAAELETRLRKEITARKACESTKEILDEEIENITAELFSRANQMVVEESKKLDKIHTEFKDLKRKYSDIKTKLEEKENALTQAAKSLYLLQNTKMKENEYFIEKATVDKVQEAEKDVPFSYSIVSGFDQFQYTMAADGIIFNEFQEFMRTVMHSSTNDATQSSLAITNSSFMKRCMQETIEPCLFYEYNHKKGLFGPQLTQSMKKKLLDSCIKGFVLITPFKHETQKPEKEKCSNCFVNRDCEYKTAFGPNEELKFVCRFCRDRILSVQDFFDFVTHLTKNATSTNSVMSTFKQIQWFRRRIALAQVGSCSIFETELSAIQGPGGGGIWEKDCDII